MRIIEAQLRRKLDGALIAEVVSVDHFGNVVTNLHGDRLVGSEILVEIGDQLFALPSASVVGLRRLPVRGIQQLEGMETFSYRGEFLRIHRLREVLGLLGVKDLFGNVGGNRGYDRCHLIATVGLSTQVLLPSPNLVH